jgi:hypothetical protein
MTAESRRTSFFALTGDHQPDDGLAIERIEIPLFQRDYAQGRDSDSVRRIRTDFLDVLRSAAAGDEPAPVGLDFVYGGVDGGTLRPLDGQQRLTTLFLLHWYTASRSGNLTEDHGWKRFSYATRQSARMFCESLAKHSLPKRAVPSEWVKDQPWYLFLWRHDPTIQSMLVMLDAIHERFLDVDAATAWSRLTDAENPAIWFLLLPLSGLGPPTGEDMRPEDLYIKMNSRGKPLTEFENFKAHFEKTIQWSPRSAEFALKVDTVWSNLLWHLRGDDDLIDDEFLRYLEFITEICEWRGGRTDGAGQRLGPRTRAVFGDQNPHRDAHLDFLFQALDVWADHSIPKTFEGLFAGTGDAQVNTTKVRLFFRADSSSQEPLNLFEACCRSYGETRGRIRAFSLGQSLVLYSVLLHLIEDIPEFPGRVRILRNLIEASTDELRPERMPKILNDVHRIICDGAVDEVETLNQAQADDEKLKAAFLAAHPQLRHAVFALEDHDLLRGSLGAFELDAAAFEARAAVYHRLMSQPALWSDLLAALLAVGEYQRRRTNSRRFLFGTDSKRHDSAWRELLTGPPRDALRSTREVLASFLDRVAAAPTRDLVDAMTAITDEYLARCEAEARFDWRYYMVKYPSMRENGSSTYVAERPDDDEQVTMGYSVCMLSAGGKALNGYYRDPYLVAIWRELDDTSAVEDKWFTGYVSEPRRLPLTRSGASIRCVPTGFELSPPPLDTDIERFTVLCADIGADASNLVTVPQVEVDGRRVDTVDRIRVGADIVRRLVAAGL